MSGEDESVADARDPWVVLRVKPGTEESEQLARAAGYVESAPSPDDPDLTDQEIDMLRRDPAQVDTVVRRLSRRPTVLEGAVRKVTVLVLVACVAVFAGAAGIAFLMN